MVTVRGQTGSPGKWDIAFAFKTSTQFVVIRSHRPIEALFFAFH